jgi:hypothetical protein
MSLRLVDLTWERYADVGLQPQQAQGVLTPERLEQLKAVGPTWAAIDESDHTICVGGLHPMPGQDGKAMAWSYIDLQAGPRFVGLRRLMDGLLALHAATWPEIWAGVLDDFEEGQRFLSVLGFERINGASAAAVGQKYQIWRRGTWQAMSS